MVEREREGREYRREERREMLEERRFKKGGKFKVDKTCHQEAEWKRESTGKEKRRSWWRALVCSSVAFPHRRADTTN
jgi:hypothetical protein